jgi:uncharacterized membrane protein YhhN
MLNHLSKSKNFIAFYLINFYIIIILIHLYSCFYHIEILRRPTKIFLIPTLILIYHQITSFKNYSKYILNGLLFGFTGDAFLLCDTNSSLLIIGILSFLIGHCLYISLYIREIGKKNFIKKNKIFVILCFFNLIIAYFVFLGIKEGISKRGIFHEATFYLFILDIESSLSSFYLFIKKDKWSLINCLGTYFFWFSDFILIRELFYNDKYKYYLNFVVMLTYIIAQTFITIGMSQKKENKKIIREKKNIFVA